MALNQTFGEGSKNQDGFELTDTQNFYQLESKENASVNLVKEGGLNESMEYGEEENGLNRSFGGSTFFG